MMGFPVDNRQKFFLPNQIGMKVPVVSYLWDLVAPLCLSALGGAYTEKIQ